MRFPPRRGCSDAIFTVQQLIAKRREHGLETWVLFIDLVKAFDRVPRELLWKVMLKYGVPPKLVELLIALHESVIVKFEIDGVCASSPLDHRRQAGRLAGANPLHLLHRAIMETWRSEHTYDLCLFRSRDDFEMTGRPPTAPATTSPSPTRSTRTTQGCPSLRARTCEEQTPRS